ncbi:hypothetical protein Hanom_Chr04g00288971 [Helianthus anomalus]
MHRDGACRRTHIIPSQQEPGVRAKIDLFASRGQVLHKHKLETPSTLVTHYHDECHVVDAPTTSLIIARVIEYKAVS